MTHSSFQESQRLSLLQLPGRPDWLLATKYSILFKKKKKHPSLQHGDWGVFLPPHEQCRTQIFPLQFPHISLGTGESVIRFWGNILIESA